MSDKIGRSIVFSKTFTGAETDTTFATHRPTQSYSIQVKGTGAAADAWSVLIEGSNDGTNFDTILNHQTSTGDGKVLFSGANRYPAIYTRIRCASLTLGAATNIVCKAIAVMSLIVSIPFCSVQAALEPTYVNSTPDVAISIISTSAISVDGSTVAVINKTGESLRVISTATAISNFPSTQNVNCVSGCTAGGSNNVTTITTNGAGLMVFSTGTTSGGPASQAGIWGASVTVVNPGQSGIWGASVTVVNPGQSGIWGTTVTFNGAQPVTISGSISNTGFSASQSGIWGSTVTSISTFTQVYIQNVATITHGGNAQPVWVVGLSTVSFNGNAQPVWNVGLATVTFNGSAQPSLQAGLWGATVTFNGTQNVACVSGCTAGGGNDITTTTFNGKAQPFWNVGLSTITHNGISQPVFLTGITGATVTFNGTQNVACVSGCSSSGGNDITTVTHNGQAQPFWNVGLSTITSDGKAIPTWNVGLSTVNIQASGTPITATGNSVNVNCTGGCGSPTQATTYIAFTTVTLLTGATNMVLMNSTTNTIKVISIRLMAYGDAAITGVVAGFKLVEISSSSGSNLNLTGSRNNVKIRRANTSDPNLWSQVKISTGASLTEIGMPIATINFSSEETTLQVNPTYLYNFENKGEKPLTFRANEGFAVKQSRVAGTAGIVGTQVIFTVE